MKLIIGLGNPGTKYSKTRHNVGSALLDMNARQRDIQFKDFKKIASIQRIRIEKQDVVFAIPNTFMNESGRAAAALKRFYKVAPQNIIVAYDDIDLPFGTIRVSHNTSSGGHKGVASIMQFIKSHNFIRLRIGIGPQVGSAESYVLKPWTETQKKELPKILDTAYAALESLITNGLEYTANRYN